MRQVQQTYPHFSNKEPVSKSLNGMLYKVEDKLFQTEHSPLDGLIAIRTLRLETSKWGRPNDPYCPSSARISQRDLNTPIPKELGLPSLEGGRLGS